MVGRLLRVGGWLALACSAVFSGREASAWSAPGEASAVDDQDDTPPAAPVRLRVRFDFVPSHDGIRTVVLDESSGRRTPLGDLPAGAACEGTAEQGEGDMRRTLELRCGSGLEVLVLADSMHNTLGIRGTYDALSDAPRFSDDLPLPPGTIFDPDGTLNDPAPQPSCTGTSEQDVELRLEHVLPDVTPYSPAETRLRASFGPIDAHVQTPGRDSTCVSKGDAAGHHYEFVCTCPSFEWSMQVHVRNRTVYAYELQRMPDTGFQTFKGRWTVPCGAHLRYPAGTEIVQLETESQDYLLMSATQKRASDEAWEKDRRDWGLEDP